MSRVQPSNEFLEPPLPQNLEAERSILGSVLLDNTVLIIAVKILRSEDFFYLHHRHIFEHMIELDLAGKPIDLVILVEHLTRADKLEAAGGVAYISQLADGLPRVSNVEYYARIVKEKSALRQVIHSSGAIQEQAFSARFEASAIIATGTESLSRISVSDQSNWLDLFDTPEEMENAPPLTFAVQGFLQTEAATLIAGLSGHFKTWLMLSIAKALLDERVEKLWDTFDVVHKASRVVYLVPESARGPLRHRLEDLRLQQYVRDRKLLVRTLSKGAAPVLQDPRILAAAQGADIFLDTAVRFMQGDENSAGDNARGFAADIFALLGAGARTIVAAAHSPKSFETQNYMSLENMVRGSGDIGATFATAWGVRKLAGDVAHIQNIKPRDFEACGPFQLAARPHINESGDFAIWKRPGDCGVLSDETPDTNKNRGGGAPEAVREARSANLALMRGWLRSEPNLTSTDLSRRFGAEGIKVGDSAIRKYRKELSP